jgi:hypothetical protein
MRARLKKRPLAARNSKGISTSVNQHNPPNRGRNHVPAPQRERILQKHIAGKSIVEITKEENRNRETVARIVHSDEMREYVQRMRERFFALADCALSTLHHALEKDLNGVLAYKLLVDGGGDLFQTEIVRTSGK